MLPHVYIALLDQNSESVISLVKSLPEDLIARPPEEPWGVLQILEHVCLTDRLVESLIARPSSTNAGSSELLGDEKLRHLMVTMRQRKVSAPDILKPKGNLKNREAFEALFLKNRESLKGKLLSGHIVIDNRTHRHPLLGELTVSDWLNFIVRHSERHLEQIKDLLNSRPSKSV